MQQEITKIRQKAIKKTILCIRICDILPLELLEKIIIFLQDEDRKKLNILRKEQYNKCLNKILMVVPKLESYHYVYGIFKYSQSNIMWYTSNVYSYAGSVSDIKWDEHLATGVKKYYESKRIKKMNFTSDI